MPDNGPGSRVSPHLQSASTRQSFSNPGQPVRIRPPALEMPPPSPSPLYSPKPGIAQQQHSPLISRSPMYSRIPYMHSPRQPMSSPNDPYGNPPLTPQPDPYSHPPSTPHPESDSPFSPNHDTYGQKMMHEQYVSVSPNEMDNSAPLSSPRGGVPQGQETRQHLRDLLQRQQIKKLEQEHSPGSCDRASPSAQRVVSPWPQGNALKFIPRLYSLFNIIFLIRRLAEGHNGRWRSRHVSSEAQSWSSFADLTNAN